MLFQTTVDSVVSQFTKTIDKLEKIILAETDALLLKKDKIAGLKKGVLKHEQEIERAAKISAKLRALLD